jgi:AcrR family transcriptional regulator
MSQTTVHTTPASAEPKGDTMQRVFDSALAVFAEKGYEGASVREIIEHAGVTRPVLYYYFKNKEDLFCKLVEFHMERLHAQIDRAISRQTSSADRLRTIAVEAFRLAEHSPEVVRLILQVFFAPNYEKERIDTERLLEMRFRSLIAVMREGIERGELRPGDPEQYARVFFAIIDGYIMEKSNCEAFKLTRQMGEQLVLLFLNGAGVTPA